LVKGDCCAAAGVRAWLPPHVLRTVRAGSNGEG
jgi:hypothetical protein